VLEINKNLFYIKPYHITPIYSLGKAIRTPVFGEIRYFPDGGGAFREYRTK
jgi:hypothetical protein